MVSVAITEAPSWSASAGAALTALLPESYRTTNAQTPAGDTVASVFAGFFQAVNLNATVGIAVAGMTGNGAWQYSPNAGSTWTTIAAASKTDALLLSSSDLVRFVPKTTAAGTATLTAYAWDASAGTHGTSANLASLGTGGASVFSATTLTAPGRAARGRGSAARGAASAVRRRSRWQRRRMGRARQPQPQWIQ